jgi:hypothetical protein
VVSIDGLVGKEAKTLLKKLSSLLAEKWEKPYSVVRGDVNSQMSSIAFIRATHLCLRGSRIPTSQMSNRRTQCEIVAARTCVEQVMDLRITLRYLGIPIRDTSYMFGDNKAVVESATRPHAKLHTRHMAGKTRLDSASLHILLRLQDYDELMPSRRI